MSDTGPLTRRINDCRRRHSHDGRRAADVAELAGNDTSCLAEQQTGAPIRVPAGSASAAVGSAFESEGGFPVL